MWIPAGKTHTCSGWTSGGLPNIPNVSPSTAAKPEVTEGKSGTVVVFIRSCEVENAYEVCELHLGSNGMGYIQVRGKFPKKADAQLFYEFLRSNEETEEVLNFLADEEKEETS